MNWNPFNRKNNRDLSNISSNCGSGCGHFDPYRQPSIRSINDEGQQRLAQVYRCVQLISDQIQQLDILPFHVWNDRKKVMYNSPVYSLFNLKLNERMTKFMFIKIMIESMLLKGNAYQYIKRDETGKPIEIIYIPSDFVLPIYNPIEFDKPVLYQVLGYDRLIEHSDMIHLVLKSVDGVLGVSVLRYQQLQLNIAINTDENANDFFASGSNIKQVIENQGKLTPKQKEDQLKAIAELREKTGSQLTILEGGATIKPITINPDDAQLIETRAFNVLTIASFFGVPASKLNSKEGTTYSNAEQEQISFLTDTIQPIIFRIEDEFERKLLSDSERVYTEIKFKVDDILRTDLKTRGEYQRLMFNMGVYSPNDLRALNDLDPIENGDNHFVQVNLMTLDQFAQGQNLKEQQNKQNKNIQNAKDQ